MKRLLHITFLLCCAFTVKSQGIERGIEERLQHYFKEYRTTQANIGACKLDSFNVDHERRTLHIYANAPFGYQPFTPENVQAIHRELRLSMPGPVNYYDITIHADGKPIGELIPNALLKNGDRDEERLWGSIRHEGEAWVTRVSRPYKITKGLAGHHMAVWQSHGSHFKNKTGMWAWQRPQLFCTTEDLFTQSFVVPFIIPMLQNAGAVVFTPRERDTQRNEVIVDNDASSPGSIYYEEKSKKSPWKTSPVKGFSHRREYYSDGEAPFVTGSARYAPTAGKKKNTHTLATWIPDIPETGAYAVYVSYQSLPGVVPDARYTVFHKGGATEFTVNQQMGGGTWVYLGTFELDKGQNDYGFVALSNESGYKGIVSADAVRFGGGMGNTIRGENISGQPRYLEGARYYAQWAGMPYTVYGGYKGENDYADDINTRSHMCNYLSGGSAYNPGQKGLKVPLELTLGVHSDAGFSREDELVGSLGIYTTNFNDGLLNAGLSRYTSRDLNDLVLTGLKRDLSAYIGYDWARRGMWNRNYSESRLPAVPSMILETLSHQNFADMKLGHDPNFKFALGRSVYKSILKYVTTTHGGSYTVQPLPVSNFAIKFANEDNGRKRSKKRKKNRQAELTWTPTTDPMEPSARATGYVVYTRIGYGGFDNGFYTDKPSAIMELEPGLVYSFKVTAINEGGESFPSETLAAYQSPQADAQTVLIVNGFDRLSGPATIENPVEQGFDLRSDAGIPYMYTTSFCGEQIGFDRRNIGIETEGGLGYSDNSLVGMKIAGNTFDYPFIHGKAIQATGRYSFTSCSDEAVEGGYVTLSSYPIVDFIAGMEKTGGRSAMNGEKYQVFSPQMQQLLTGYLKQGGSLMASGAFIGNDPILHTATGKEFVTSMLRFTPGNPLPLPHTAGNRSVLYTSAVTNGRLAVTIPRTLNETHLAVTSPATLQPAAPAFAALAYDNGHPASVCYPGTDYRTFILGFPFECIRETDGRARLMAMILNFLSKKE